MKILAVNSLTVTADAEGGAERSVQLTCEALRKRGVRAYIIGFYKERRVTIRCVNGVPVVRVPLVNIYWPFGSKQRGQLKRTIFNILDLCNPISIVFAALAIRRIKPDVIWTNMIKGWSPTVWLLALLMRVPVVATVREFGLIYTGSSVLSNPEAPKKQPFVWRFNRSMSGLPASAVAISDAMAEIYRSHGYFRRHISVVGNPVDGPFVGTAKSRKSVDVVHVGWLGRFSAEKGLQVFLSAVREAQTEKRLQFHVAGDGDDGLLSAVEEMSDSGELNYAGFVDSTEFLRRMDVLVVSSLWPEPFGRVVVEAFRCGCFVVSSDRGALPQINANPKCGMVYDGSVGGLTKSLEALLPWEPKDPQDFANQISAYIPDAIAAQYEAIFNEVLCR